MSNNNNNNGKVSKWNSAKAYQAALGICFLLEALVSVSPADIMAGPVDEVLTVLINMLLMYKGFNSNGNNETPRK